MKKRKNKIPSWVQVGALCHYGKKRYCRILDIVNKHNGAHVILDRVAKPVSVDLINKTDLKVDPINFYQLIRPRGRRFKIYIETKEDLRAEIRNRFRIVLDNYLYEFFPDVWENIIYDYYDQFSFEMLVERLVAVLLDGTVLNQYVASDISDSSRAEIVLERVA